MAKRVSAGVLMYRRRGEIEVFLVHPGGPFWASKDAGAWSVPKGEPSEAEALFEAARREFTEETGFRVDGDFRPLDPITQPGGKVVHVWIVEGDCEPGEVRSNTFAMEWPPKSGRRQEFPEVDRAAWFGVAEARRRMLPGQVGFLGQLLAILDGSEAPGTGPETPR